MTGKYTPLEQYLTALPASQEDVTLSFEQVERILNDKLPPSAQEHQAWWENESEGSHIQAHSWMDVGWKVDAVNLTEKWVRFVQQ